MKKNLVVIPARGGSKRIPHKNIKNFCGKPIIVYSINAAKESGIFDEIMVSTDDEEIKKIAIQYGANIPFMRSEKTSNDLAITYDVLVEVINKYKELGIEFENVCCLYPTAPFVTSDKLREAFQILEKEDVQGVYPVVSFSFPPQRGIIIENGYARFKYPKYALTRSQDLEIIYHDCGQFYFLKETEMLKQKKLILDNMVPMVVSELEAQDIDNEKDWMLAELKYKML